MLSLVIEAFKKVGCVPLYTFRKSLFGIQYVAEYPDTSV